MKSRCLCYSLRHGTVIIGVLFMISSGVMALMEIGIISEWSDIQHNITNENIKKRKMCFKS